MPQTEVAPDLRSQLREYLQSQGYKVTEEASLLGKSGIKHTFDMLAEKNDGFSNHSVCIAIAAGGDKEVEASAIFTLANKAFDTGIGNRLLIAVPGFSEKSKQLANKQRIKVIDGESIGTLLTAKTKQASGHELPIRFETASELMESLASRGYRVEEKGKIKGKSGLEHAFDILARIDGDQVERTLAVDFLNSAKEVGLDQVALFDTKAFDAAIDAKVIVVSPTLTNEARQFAQHQHIRVLEWNPKPAPRPSPVDEKTQEKAEKKDAAHGSATAGPRRRRPPLSTRTW